MTFNNTIIHGDCVHALAQLDTASVDFVLTDPPYLVNYPPATVVLSPTTLTPIGFVRRSRKSIVC